MKIKLGITDNNGIRWDTINGYMVKIYKPIPKYRIVEI